MIQRIQTVFLFLAVIALIAFNLLPYWQAADVADGEIAQLMSYGYVTGTVAEPTIEFGLFSVVAGVAGLVMILVIVEILSFKSRVTQLKIAIGVSFLMSINLVLMTYLILDLQKEYQGSIGIGMFIFAMAMILNIVARRFIQKDEKLVKSVDRLR